MPFTNCERDFSPIEIEKFFHPDMLSQVYLDKISYFWQNDTIRTQSDPIAHFRHSYGYLKGLELIGNRKSIRVFVFQTKIDAINSAEKYQLSISRITSKGYENKYIKEKWWYVVNNPLHAIHINKYNTIIQIIYHGNTTNSFIFQIAYDVLKRIELFSTML